MSTRLARELPQGPERLQAHGEHGDHAAPLAGAALSHPAVELGVLRLRQPPAWRAVEKKMVIVRITIVIIVITKI